MFVWKDKNKWKEARDGPLKNHFIVNSVTWMGDLLQFGRLLVIHDLKNWPKLPWTILGELRFLVKSAMAIFWAIFEKFEFFFSNWLCVCISI